MKLASSAHYTLRAWMVEAANSEAEPLSTSPFDRICLENGRRAAPEWARPVAHIDFSMSMTARVR